MREARKRAAESYEPGGASERASRFKSRRKENNKDGGDKSFYDNEDEGSHGERVHDFH